MLKAVPADADMTLANVVRLKFYATDVGELLANFPRMNARFGTTRYPPTLLPTSSLEAVVGVVVLLSSVLLERPGLPTPVRPTPVRPMPEIRLRCDQGVRGEVFAPGGRADPSSPRRSGLLVRVERLRDPCARGGRREPEPSGGEERSRRRSGGTLDAGAPHTHRRERRPQGDRRDGCVYGPARGMDLDPAPRLTGWFASRIGRGTPTARPRSASQRSCARDACRFPCVAEGRGESEVLQRPSPLWWEVSRVGALLADALLVMGMVVAVLLVLACAGRLAVTHRPSWGRAGFRWWVHRRAVRYFVAAVAAGDMGVADVAARRVLGRHGPAGGAPLRS